MKYDAIIVGARVAGAATAMLLAQGGAKVLLIDRAVELGDTLSTHALMRGGVNMLEDWGLADSLISGGAPAVTATTFQYGQESIRIQMTRRLMAPRRWALDRTLLDAAMAAGVEVQLGVSFEGCLIEGGRVCGVRLLDKGIVYNVRAGLVVGADGRQSRVARSVAAPVLAETPQGSSTLYGYFPDLPEDGFLWMFSQTVQAGFIPTNGGEHCVFGSFRPKVLKSFNDPSEAFVSAIAGFDPERGETVRALIKDVRLRRFAGAKGHLRAAAGDGWALVGDAGFFKDQATAHGISDALMDAARLSSAVLDGDLMAYGGARDVHAFDMLRISHRIGSFDWTIPELKVLHQELNVLMKAEAQAFDTEIEWPRVA